MREGGEPNTPLTALVGVVFAIVLFVTIVLLQAYFYHAERDEAARKVAVAPPEELSQLRAQQLETLNSYRYVDPRAGVVAIPIDRAMELFVRDGGRVPWAVVQPPPVMAKPAPPAPAAKAKE